MKESAADGMKFALMVPTDHLGSAGSYGRTRFNFVIRILQAGEVQMERKARPKTAVGTVGEQLDLNRDNIRVSFRPRVSNAFAPGC